MSALRRLLDELDLYCSMDERDAAMYVRGMATMFVLVIGTLIVSTLLHARLFGGGA